MLLGRCVDDKFPEFSEFCQSHARTGHTWLGGPTLGGEVRPKTAGNLSESRPQSPLTLMNPRTRSTHFLVSRDRMTTNISSGMDMMQAPVRGPRGLGRCIHHRDGRRRR